MVSLFMPGSSLGRFVESLASKRDVVAPVDKGGTLLLEKVTTMEGVATNGASLPVVPPKDVFFPQTQVLMRYKTLPTLQISREPLSGRPVVLFGVKPCDVRSFSLLDKVFAQGQFNDASYVERRNNTAIVSFGCTKAANTCFCTSMGASPVEAPGADLLFFPVDGGYAVDVLTEKGQVLLDDADLKLSDLDQKDTEAVQSSMNTALASITLKVDTNGVTDALGNLFESEYWANLASRCIGCGVCSYICPTCHCFDIQDEAVGTEGYRMRCWDCCMFSDFTRMAGGHNPRPSKKERIQHRFMHKLRYFQVNNGEIACVGCGRCLSKCPGGQDITEVVEEVKAGV